MSPETESLLEQMRDNPGAFSQYAAGAALNEIARLRALVEELKADRIRINDEAEANIKRLREAQP